MNSPTPAPWGIVKSAAQSNNPDSVRVDIVGKSDATPFSNGAFIAGDILPDDARLMVAAPELLAALEKLVGHVLHYAAMPHAHADADKDAAAALAAIKQATT